MSNYKNYRDYILDKLDERTLLEQLAEEASELSQAALKLIRAKGLSENITPKMKQSQPELAAKLELYQDKCADVLASVFIDKTIPKTQEYTEILNVLTSITQTLTALTSTLTAMQQDINNF